MYEYKTTKVTTHKVTHISPHFVRTEKWLKVRPRDTRCKACGKEFGEWVGLAFYVGEKNKPVCEDCSREYADGGAKLTGASNTQKS